MKIIVHPSWFWSEREAGKACLELAKNPYRGRTGTLSAVDKSNPDAWVATINYGQAA